MLRFIAILGIVVLIGILNMAPGHEGGGGGGGDPGGGGGGDTSGGGGGGGGDTSGGGTYSGGDTSGGGTYSGGSTGGTGGTGTTVGSFTGTGTTVGSFTGPGTTVGSFTGTGTTVGSFTGPGTAVGSFTGPGTTVGSITGPGTTVGSFTGAGGQVYSAASSFGEKGAPAGFTFGSFSATAGAFPGGGATAGAFPGGGATAGAYPGGGATAGAFPGGGQTGGGFPSFAGFSFGGGSGGQGGGVGGPQGVPQISELGVFGNFGVIGELKAGGSVGSNYALLDNKSGHVLDLSGLGKEFADFFSRPEGALAAVQNVSDLKPGDIAALGGGFAAEQLGKIDFLGFHDMKPELLGAMMKEAGASGLSKLKDDQLAGAFGAMKPEDIKGLGNVVGDAVGNLGANDFLAIPPDQVLAMLQSTVLNFNPQAVGGLQKNIEQHSGKLDGMMAAMTAGQYKGIDGGQMVAIMQAMNLGGEGFDRSKTVLEGKDVASMLGVLDQQRLGELGGDKVLGSIKDLQKGDFKDVDAKGALNIFNTVGSDKALELKNLGGIVGKFDADAFKQVGSPGTFGIVKALEAADLKALDKSAALGAAKNLDATQLGELDGKSLAGLITGVKEGVLDLDTKQVEGFLKGIGKEDVGTLDKGVAGSLVGAALDADFKNLSAEIKGAYLSTLAADLLGKGAAGFEAGGPAADTVFNIVPAGAYNGQSLAQVIGASGAPNLFGGNLFGGSP